MRWIIPHLCSWAVALLRLSILIVSCRSALAPFDPIAPRSFNIAPMTVFPSHIITPPQAGSAMDEDDARKGKACVIKTSTRQTIYLPIPGLVEVDQLKPGDLIGTVRRLVLFVQQLW